MDACIALSTNVVNDLDVANTCSRLCFQTRSKLRIWSGVDRVVKPGPRSILIAQRWREDRRGSAGRDCY